jgi:hypothetical protein
MLKHMRFNGVALGVLAITAIFAAGPAGAASSHKSHVAVVHPGTCWQYENRFGRWVNVCRTQAYESAYPRPVPVFPYPFHGYYPYHYVPPYAANGPYYGQEPYNSYQSTLGFSF